MKAEEITKYLEIMLDMHKNLYIQSNTIALLKKECRSLAIPQKINPPTHEKSSADYKEGIASTGVISGIIIAVITALIALCAWWKNAGIFAILFAGILGIALGVVGGLVIGIIFGPIIEKCRTNSYQKELNREYKEELRHYEQLVEDDKKRVKYEKAQQDFLFVKIQVLTEQKDKTIENIRKFASLDIIDKTYQHDIVAIASFYQYFRTKQTYSLGFDPSTGDIGAYRIYENQKLQQMIICKLDVVISKLDQIIDNQWALYECLSEANRKIDALNSNVIKASKNLRNSIDTHTAIENYNSERMQKELEYQNMMNTIFKWR